VPHLNKSLARSNKNPFYQGFLTGIATINLVLVKLYGAGINYCAGKLHSMCVCYELDERCTLKN